MLNERIFTLITRLIYGRWARHYDEHHGPYEDACMASFGPFHLSYTVCLGDEPIRPSGWRVWWQRPYRPTPPNASSEEFLL